MNITHEQLDQIEVFLPILTKGLINQGRLEETDKKQLAAALQVLPDGKDVELSSVDETLAAIEVLISLCCDHYLKSIQSAKSLSDLETIKEKFYAKYPETLNKLSKSVDQVDFELFNIISRAQQAEAKICVDDFDVTKIDTEDLVQRHKEFAKEIASNDSHHIDLNQTINILAYVKLSNEILNRANHTNAAHAAKAITRNAHKLYKDKHISTEDYSQIKNKAIETLVLAAKDSGLIKRHLPNLEQIQRLSINQKTDTAVLLYLKLIALESKFSKFKKTKTKETDLDFFIRIADKIENIEHLANNLFPKIDPSLKQLDIKILTKIYDFKLSIEKELITAFVEHKEEADTVKQTILETQEKARQLYASKDIKKAESEYYKKLLSFLVDPNQSDGLHLPLPHPKIIKSSSALSGRTDPATFNTSDLLPKNPKKP